MKIEIECNSLKDGLAKLKETVSARNTMPILSNALLEAREDNTLILHATDYDVSISTGLPCEVLEPGSVTVHAMTLHKLISTIRADTVRLEMEENFWIKITAESFSCRLAGTHADDFPQMTKVDDFKFITFDAELLVEMIDKTAFCISTDDARPAITGAFLQYTEDNTLVMVCTDGHRLGKLETHPDEYPFDVELPPPLLEGIIIPQRGIKQLRKTLDPKTYPLELGIHRNSIAFKHGPTTVVVRLIEGTYPNYRQILPKPYNNSASIDSPELIYSLKFIQLFSNSKTNRVRFSFTKENLNIYSNDPETGEGSKDLPITFTGDAEVIVGYNIKYLIELLVNLDCASLKWDVIDALSPTIVTDADNDRRTYIVMPMRF